MGINGDKKKEMNYIAFVIGKRRMLLVITFKVSPEDFSRQKELSVLFFPTNKLK